MIQARYILPQYQNKSQRKSIGIRPISS